LTLVDINAAGVPDWEQQWVYARDAPFGFWHLCADPDSELRSFPVYGIPVFPGSFFSSIDGFLELAWY